MACRLHGMAFMVALSYLLRWGSCSHLPLALPVMNNLQARPTMLWGGGLPGSLAHGGDSKSSSQGLEFIWISFPPKAGISLSARF